jgi:two-component system KDP operon response regulator KdpE
MEKILVVENDPNIRKLVRVNLVKRGYSVSEAEDSHQAKTHFKEEAVDLVVLDLMLPGLSCTNVCSWIRARSDVPIIVLSSRVEQDLKAATINAGANAYITKPFELDEFLSKIRTLLRNSYPIPQSHLMSKMQFHHQSETTNVDAGINSGYRMALK